MITKFGNLTLFVKIIVILDLIAVLTQTVFILLFFTAARTLVSSMVIDSVGAYDEVAVFGFFISIVIFTLLVRGLLNRKHWAVLLQIFLLLPSFFSFPIGIVLFVVLVYKLVKLERIGYFS